MNEDTYINLLEALTSDSLKVQRRAVNKATSGRRRIRARRQETEQTQQAVAKGTGISLATYKRLEDDPTKIETLSLSAQSPNILSFVIPDSFLRSISFSSAPSLL